MTIDWLRCCSIGFPLFDLDPRLHDHEEDIAIRMSPITMPTLPAAIAGSGARLDHHQEHDHHDQHPEEHPAPLDLLDRGHELGRRPGRRARRWRCRGELDRVVERVALDGQRVPQRDHVQVMPSNSQGVEITGMLPIRMMATPVTPCRMASG